VTAVSAAATSCDGVAAPATQSRWDPTVPRRHGGGGDRWESDDGAEVTTTCRSDNGCGKERWVRVPLIESQECESRRVGCGA
jgi:hypothetical protein